MNATSSFSDGFVVGVTGSGKGMTEVASRGKHKFMPTDEPNA